MNRKAIWAAACLLVLSLAAMAQATEVSGIKVIDYGLVKETPVQAVRPDTDGLIKEVVNLEDVQFMQQTDSIPAQLGTEFGFLMQLEGAPAGDEVELVFLLITPGLETPAGKVFKEEFVETNQIGDAMYIGYNLGRDWELVPGSWTYLVFYRGKKLLEKSFNVLAAQ